MPPEPTVCAVCGREITWRKQWTRDWTEVRYCSDTCRRRRREVGAGSAGEGLEDAVRRVLSGRVAGATTCPSEVARAVGGADEAAWRPLMEPVREAARRLAAAGELEWLQRGSVIDPSHAKGPVRLRPTPHLQPPAEGAALRPRGPARGV